MFGRLIDTTRHTWSLMGSSWDVLRDTPSLIVFPILSGLACGGVLAAGYVFGGDTALLYLDQPGDMGVLDYGLLFVLLFVLYFIGTFFNVALIGTAVLHMIGQRVTVAEGFRIAGRRVVQIAGWAALQASVGLILQVIEDKAGNVAARLVGSLAGVAWTVVSFMVVPVLVVEHRGPIQALKESAGILKKTWGRQLIGNVSFSLVATQLVLLVGFVVVLVGVALGGTVGLFGGLALVALLGLVVAIVVTALRSIFQGALYLYARHGRHLSAFSRQEIMGAFTGKGGLSVTPPMGDLGTSGLGPVEQAAWQQRVAGYRMEEERRREERRGDGPG